MGDTNQQDGGRNGVSRRSFVKAAGASGVAVGLAGCMGGGGNGSGNGSGGGNGGGNAGSGGTVKWSFDPTQAQENGKKIEQLFYDNGLSQDIDLQLIPAPQKTGSVQQSYTNLLRAGQESPDMFMMDCGWTIPFIVRDLLVNLTEQFSDSRIETVNKKYFDASVETTKHPRTGELYGVPLFPDLPTMQYRKDLVEKAGYQPDKKGWATNPMSWKKFNKVTADVMKQTGTEMGFSFQYDSYAGLSCCTFNEFMTSWGGAYFGGRENLYGPVGKRPVTVAEDPVKKSQRMVRTFIHGQDDSAALPGYSKITPEGVLTWAEQSSRQPFGEGKVVMHRNWPYAIPLTINKAEWATTETYGVMPLPYGVPEDKTQGVGGSSPALGGWHMTVNPNSPNKKAVYEVIKTAMKKKTQIGLFEITGWLPPRTDVLTSNAAQKVKPTGKYLKTFEIAGKNAIPRPVTVVWPQESKATYQTINPIASQEKPVGKGLKDLSGRIKQIEQQFSEGN